MLAFLELGDAGWDGLVEWLGMGCGESGGLEGCIFEEEEVRGGA